MLNMTDDSRTAMARACAETFGQLTESTIPQEGEFIESSIYKYLDTASKITERLFAGFKLQAERIGHTDTLNWGGISHGYQVVGKGVINCASSYGKHCAIKAGSDYQRDELINALMNPKTIEFFTDISQMSSKENREYEAFFGLKDSTNYGFVDYFIFDPELNCFLPNSVLLREAKLGAARNRISRAEEDNVVSVSERCVATRFIPMVWRQTVLAYDDEGIFIPDDTPS